MTYNMLGAKVANMLKQPFSLELHNRIIDAYKQLFATRIRQTFERNGIDSQLKLSYEAPLVTAKVLIPKLGIYGLRTTNKVPKPIRFMNDAPYTNITSLLDIGKRISFTYTDLIKHKQSSFIFPTGYFGYLYEDGYIYLISTKTIPSDPIVKLDLVYTEPITPVTNVTSLVTQKVTIESVFFSPEEVLTMDDPLSDGLDLELPFPEDMIVSVTQELLKVEFGVISPQDNLDVNLIQNETTRPV